MKVICIDNKPHGLSPHEESLKLLVEGGTYTIIDYSDDLFGQGYLLSEVKSSHFTGRFKSSRFIPLSNIDERELINEREGVEAL